MRWFRVASLFPHNLQRGDTSCFSMESLDYIRRQCLILCGSYKPFGLFLPIPLLQPIPWPLRLDLFCWTQCLAVKGLVFQFLIFSKVSSFSSSVCGVPHFLSYLFKFYCFLQWFRDVLNAIVQLHLFIENTLLQAIQYTAPRKSSKVGSFNISFFPISIHGF